MDSRSSFKCAQLKFYDWTRKWTENDENFETNRTPDLLDFLNIFQILGFSIYEIVRSDLHKTFVLQCGERAGIKIFISCGHTGVRFGLDGYNCSQTKEETVQENFINPHGEQRKETYKDFRLLDISDGEKLVIQTVLSHLVQMMHSTTKHNDQNQNIEEDEQFQNVPTESKTPRKSLLEQYFTPDVPTNYEIIKKYPEAEVPLTPTSCRSLDTLTGKAPLSEFPEPEILAKNEVTSDTYNVPTVTVVETAMETKIIENNPEVYTEVFMSPVRYRSLDTLVRKTPFPEFPESGISNTDEVTSDKNNVPTIFLSSPNLNTPVKPSTNTSSPVVNVSILKQGYSKLLSVQDLLKEAIGFFDKAQAAQELPKFSFDVSNIKESNESLDAKKTVSNSDTKLIKKNTKTIRQPVKSVSTYKRTFTTTKTTTTTSNISKPSAKPNTTKKLAVNDSPVFKNKNKPNISSAGKTQKYTNIKSSIPKVNSFKKL